MVIYKITNQINGKIYIGQTIEYEERIRHHKQTPFRKASRDYNKPLYKAIRKYGVDNFKFEIIDTAETIEELNEKEIRYIEEYDCLIDTGKGYNLETGGGNGHKSEHTKKKIGDAQRGELNHSYGKRASESWHAKQVINITTGKTYPSMIDCAIAEYGDRKYMKNISAVCSPTSNKQSFRGNVYRKFDANGNIIEKITKPLENIHNVAIIECNSGQIYNSFEEASRELGIATGRIRDRVYGRVKPKPDEPYLFELYVS